jgi:NitT/TauT family transport system substrate-binding protein
MFRKIVYVVLATILLAACGATGPAATAPTAGQPTEVQPPAEMTAPPAQSGAASPTDAQPATAQPTAGTANQATATHEVIVAMPYVPNVQFAHFYVADKKGYYAQAGIKVTFDYNYETDVVQRVAQNTVQFGLASGDSVLLARGQGLPVVTVATNSQKFPIVLFSKATENITKPADLKGKSVGIPGRFGASYIGLQALLYANHMSENDMNVQEIGFTQVQAVQQDKVQVGVGYGNNEPIQLEQQGIKTNVIRVSDYFPLASDGLITSETLINQEPDVVRGFVQATMKGMQDVIDNPDEGFNTALEYIPEAQRGDTQLQRKVLQATLDYWQSDVTAKQGLGYTDADSWQATYKFLRDSNLLKTDVDVSKAYTNEFITK